MFPGAGMSGHPLASDDELQHEHGEIRVRSGRCRVGLVLGRREAQIGLDRAHAGNRASYDRGLQRDR